MSALRDALVRRRQDLNPLSTALPPSTQSFQTPISAVSLSSPYGYHPASYTPLTAVRQYNPQQWEPSAVGPENAVHYPPALADETEGVSEWAF